MIIFDIRLKISKFLNGGSNLKKLAEQGVVLDENGRISGGSIGWLKVDTRNFTEIIRDWQLSLKTVDAKSFLEKNYLGNVITPQDLEALFSHDPSAQKVLGKELIRFLSALVPPEICGIRMFCNRGIKDLSNIADDKKIIQADKSKLADSILERLDIIFNERSIRPGINPQNKARIQDIKYKDFLEDFSEIVDKWLESIGRSDVNIDFDVLVKHTQETLGITQKQFMGVEKLSPEKAKKSAELFADIFRPKNTEDTADIDNYNKIYELAFSFWDEKSSYEKRSEDKYNAFGTALKFLRISKGKSRYSFEDVHERTIALQERGITSMKIDTMNRVFTGFKFFMEKSGEDESEFDKITKFLKKVFPEYSIGVGSHTKDGMVVLRALQQQNLSEGLELLKKESGKNIFGNALRFIRIYKNKSTTSFEGLGEGAIDSSNISAAEAGRERPYLETLNKMVAGYNLSHKRSDEKEESEFDLITNFMKEILPYYKKKVGYNTKETIVILRALQQNSMENGLKLLSLESEKNILGNTLKYIRIYKNKTLHDFSEVEASNLARIELGNRTPGVELLNAIFNGFDLKKGLRGEEVVCQFDIVTNFLKDQLPHFSKGVTGNTKEEVIILRALQQKDLKEGLEIIGNESHVNVVGNTVKFIRIFKEKLNNKGVGDVSQSSVSQKELGTANYSAKSFSQFLLSIGLSKDRLNNKESEFDIVTDFLKNILSAQIKGFSKEELIISLALNERDLKGGLDMLASEIEHNILGNTLKFVRLYKDIGTAQFDSLKYKDISAKESGRENPSVNFLNSYFEGLNLERDESKIVMAHMDEHILILQPKTKITYEKRDKVDLYVEGTWQSFLENSQLSKNNKNLF